MLGYEETVRVTMDDMLHHTKAVVARHAAARWSSATCPSCATRQHEDALANAGRFISEGGAQAVKLEGGVRSARTIEASSRPGSRSWATSA